MRKILYIFDNIKSTKEAASTFWGARTIGNLWLLFQNHTCRKLLLKIQWRHPSRLPTVRFRGTPCILIILSWFRGILIDFVIEKLRENVKCWNAWIQNFWKGHRYYSFLKYSGFSNFQYRLQKNMRSLKFLKNFALLKN